MSKSIGNAIFLSDSTDEIRRKVYSMFTDPKHLKIEDPGVVEGNVVFMFLDFFDPNKEELESLKAHYRHGGLGDGQLKRRLVDILDSLIKPMRTRRQEYASDLSYVRQILQDGTSNARRVVSNKVDMAKRAMNLIHF